MKCIFCKIESDTSISIEHIIPESLGNKEHVLEKGIVCDKCNQYFALKIEKEVLDYPYFKHVRHINDIASKKGKIPLIQGIMGGIVDIGKDKHGKRFINIKNPKTMERFESGQIKHMIVPKFDEPPREDKIFSRFLGKVAIESLAYIFYPDEGWNEEIIDKPELDKLRQYVRYGEKTKFWEYHQRRIYNESDRFLNPKISNEPYEVLHEFAFQSSKDGELFFILVIMGIEYALSMGNPKINEYKKWLITNGQRSPIEDRDEKRIIKNYNNNKSP